MKNRPTLGQIISGTKCERDKVFFLQKERVNKIGLGIKKGPKWDRKMSTTGVNRAEVPHHLQVWECPPPPGQTSQHNKFKFVTDTIESDDLKQ